MKRCFGMMPADCIEVCKQFKDSNGLSLQIEAGPFGWTIIWADLSSTYQDVDDTTDNNFQRAHDAAVSMVGPLTLDM